jgi:hypothetical protein
MEIDPVSEMLFFNFFRILVILNLALCLCIPPPLIFVRRLIRSPCCQYVCLCIHLNFIGLWGLWNRLAVYLSVCTPLICSLSVRFRAVSKESRRLVLPRNSCILRWSVRICPSLVLWLIKHWINVVCTVHRLITGDLRTDIGQIYRKSTEWKSRGSHWAESALKKDFATSSQALSTVGWIL